MKKLISGIVAVAAMALIMGCATTAPAGAAASTGAAKAAAKVGPDIETLHVGLGAENVLNVTKVTVNGEEYDDMVWDYFKPSSWNAVGEFLAETLEKGDEIEFTFNQLNPGQNPWNTWSIAVWADEDSPKDAKGQFMRADTWLNSSTDAGFKGGLWAPGNQPGNFKFEKGQNYVSVGQALKSSDEVVVKVVFEESNNIIVTETVNGNLVMTIASRAWY